jgi:hypothetical protein
LATKSLSLQVPLLLLFQNPPPVVHYNPGFTSRVSELLEMVKHLQHIGNEPFPIVETPRPPEEEREEYKSTATQKEWIAKWKEKRDKWRDEEYLKSHRITRRMSSSRISFEAPQVKVFLPSCSSLPSILK